MPWHGGNVRTTLQGTAANGWTYTIPAGTRVIVDILSTHNASADGMLSNWMGDLRDNNANHPEHAAGLGARHCPGGKLARHGIALILSELLREYLL